MTNFFRTTSYTKGVKTGSSYYMRNKEGKMVSASEHAFRKNKKKDMNRETHLDPLQMIPTKQ